MEAGSRWAPVPWRHADERRFLLALGLSALVHAWLLLSGKLPRTDWRAAGASVLNVSFRAAALPPSPPQAVDTSGAGKRDVPALLWQAESSHAVALPSAGRQVTASVVPARPARTVPVTSAMPQPLQAGHPAAGPVNRPAPPAGGVNALLTIGENGRVADIYWNELPALTDRQLQRIEAAIRQRTYPRGVVSRTLSENIDVRALLRLPAVPDAENATAVAAPE